MLLQTPSSAHHAPSWESSVALIDSTAIYCKDFGIDIDNFVFKMEVVDDWWNSKKKKKIKHATT